MRIQPERALMLAVSMIVLTPNEQLVAKPGRLAPLPDTKPNLTLHSYSKPAVFRRPKSQRKKHR